MKKFVLHLLLTTMICLLLANCRHKCEKEPDAKGCPDCCEDQSLEGMKDYFYFKTGTWWVYEEQNSGALDTVEVYYDEAGTFGGYDDFKWKASSSFFEYNFYHSFNESYSIYCLTNKDCTCNKLNREKSRPGDYVGGGQYFIYPLIEGNYTNTFDGVSKVEEIFSELVVLDSTYQFVAQIDVQNDKSTTNLGQHTKYWWAKNAGIVQFQNIGTGTDWRLKESFIIQY